MESLQYIVNDLFNIHICDDLIQLLSEFLSSEYAKIVEKELIEKFYDETSLGFYDNRVNIVTIPIEYIIFDWIKFFEIVLDEDAGCGSIEPRYGCACIKIPDKIELYKCVFKGPIKFYIVSVCVECGHRNTINIRQCKYLDEMILLHIIYWDWGVCEEHHFKMIVL